MLYYHSYSHARERGELAQWEESWHENVRCKRFVDEQLAGYTCARNPESMLNELYRNFTKEHIEYVLAKTIQERSADKHFDDAAKQWANRYQFYPEDNLSHMCLLMVLTTSGSNIALLLRNILKRQFKSDKAG